jgi:DNA-binding NarL/FixJ family response regulator
VIRIIIADDHTIFRQGLRSLIQKADDIELVAECSSGAKTLELVRIHDPDVAVLDISMPDIDGITLAAQLNKIKSRSAVIILSSHNDPVLYEQAGNVGALGYVLKNNAFEDLMKTIRQAAAGINTMVTNDKYYGETSAAYTLTVREREVLGLIVNGLTNRMMAETLGISVKTVDRHRTNMMMKLQLHSTAELVRYAMNIGIV